MGKKSQAPGDSGPSQGQVWETGRLWAMGPQLDLVLVAFFAFVGGNAIYGLITGERGGWWTWVVVALLVMLVLEWAYRWFIAKGRVVATATEIRVPRIYHRRPIRVGEIRGLAPTQGGRRIGLVRQTGRVVQTGLPADHQGINDWWRRVGGKRSSKR